MDQFVSCRFSANHLVEVVTDMYPSLVHGKDFLTVQGVDADGLVGDPWFAFWRAKDIPEPDLKTLKEQFLANDTKYRASLARRFRDSLLEWSDGKADVPGDAPASVQARAVKWSVYRQDLRDLTVQPGFPRTCKFPTIPG